MLDWENHRRGENTGPFQWMLSWHWLTRFGVILRALPQKRTVLHMMCQFWDSAEWSDRVTLNWEFSLNSSSVELSIRPIHMKNSKMGLFSKKRELICIIEDWHYWEPIRSPFRHDHVIIDCQSKATLVYNRQFRDWRIFIAFADGSAMYQTDHVG